MKVILETCCNVPDEGILETCCEQYLMKVILETYYEGT